MLTTDNENQEIYAELQNVLFCDFKEHPPLTSRGKSGTVSGTTIFTAGCYAQVPGSLESRFDMVCYPGTDCEIKLKITVFEEYGFVTTEKMFRQATYGFSIEVLSGNSRGFISHGHKDRGIATMMAFGQAAAYGNGGFPLDRLVARA